MQVEKVVDSNTEPEYVILVIEEDQSIYLQIQAALKELAPLIIHSNNAEITPSILHQKNLALVLLDAKLLNSGGEQLYRQIKADQRLRHIKVIIIGPAISTAKKQKYLESGIDDYLSRPIKLRQLQAQAQIMLSLSKTERELYRHNRQLEELVRVSHLINRRLDQLNISQEIISSCLSLTDCEIALVLLYDEKIQGHRLLTTTIQEYQKYQGYIIPDGEGISSVVRRTGRMMVVDDYRQFPARVKLPVDIDLHQVAALPLLNGDRYIGVMIVVHSRTGKQFSQDDLDFLSNLANLGAVALDNARLYHELSRSEKNYRLLFEKASDLIIALNYENIIGYINQRVISILGYNPPDLMGKDARMVFTRASYQVLIRQHEKMAEGNLLPSDTLELTMTGKEGQLITLEFSFTQLTHDNETPGLLGIGRDLTVRKRIEEQERMRMLGQLASGVAHDFNNILAIVLGHAQLIEEAIENEEIRRTLQIIAQSARDGADTVRRIQEFTGQRTDRPSNQVDLNRIVRDTLELSRPRWRNAAQKDGLYYEIVQSFEALPPVLGKASELREVVINIINNALDAMLPPGGRLAFATRHRPPWVELEISDTGKGIEPDILSRIFEPFFTTKGTRGTGLGLSIAKNIITRHGGELLCASTVGVGTIFTIKLPAVDKQTIENIAEDIPLENGKEMGKQNQGRILAIDDDPGIRNVLKRVLQSGGYNVELAASALEALKLLKAADKGNGYPFDLILSDLGMPEMSGWDLAREVKKRWPRVPILLITGWGEQVDATRMNENSIRDIIPKPFNIQDLLKQVNRHIHS